MNSFMNIINVVIHNTFIYDITNKIVNAKEEFLQETNISAFCIKI